MTRPIASVAICARNEAQRLRECLTPLLSAAGELFEIIIVDDASTDGTSAAATAMGSGRIRVLRNDQPKGVAVSRNIALKAAGGEIVVVVDADDLSVPSRIRTQVGFLADNPSVSVVGAYARFIDADGRELAEARTPRTSLELRAAASRRAPLIHGTVAFRTAAAVAVGGYREKLPAAADYDLIYRLLQRGEGATIPEVLCTIRLRPESLSVRRRRVQAECIAAVKRFGRERDLTGVDSYEAWQLPTHVLDPDPETSAAGRYHLLAGKLAASAGRFSLAREHLRGCLACPGSRIQAATLLGALACGPRAYSFLRSLLGSEGGAPFASGAAGNRA